MGTWLLIFTNFVPISLMVTLEMVRFLQGIKISLDELTFSRSGGGVIVPVAVQSSNLNEELG
jgi:phospholipid-transporting ATPase